MFNFIECLIQGESLKWYVTNLCLCFLRWLPPGIYTGRPHKDIQCHVLYDATCFSHIKHTCKSTEQTCPSVISLLIMEITIKILSHSGVILFLDSKVQSNPKLHSARGLQKLNGKFHYVNFIKLGTPTVSPKYIWYVIILVRI